MLSSSPARAKVRENQIALNYFSFPAGTPDGIQGRNTRDAIAVCLLALLTAVMLSVAIARRMSYPLWQMSEVSQSIARGDFDQRLPAYGVRELNVLSRSFNQMVHRLQGLFTQVEARRLDLEARVEERTAHLTQKNYQLKLLLRSVSHDLRNPLMGLLMVLNNIRQDSDASTVALPRRVLDTLIGSGERQLRLVNSLLEDHYIDDAAVKASGAPPPDLSQVEPLLNQRSPAMQPVALSNVAAQVAQDVQPLLERHQATLTVSLAQTLPPVLADPDQLWRVIENLISNAIAHNAPGVHIVMMADVMTSARTGPTICFKVMDDGEGISMAQQQRLFEPYQQGSKDSPGLGLGLYICRRIVEAHGGTMGVMSQPGAGATFWFTLPVAPSQMLVTA